MTAKESIIERIRQMPDDLDEIDIVEELFVRMKIDEGLRAQEAGEVISHDQFKERFARWLN